MKVLNKIQINFFLLFLLYSCGSARQVSIKSTPAKANVYVREIGSDKAEKIGQTPLILDEDIIRKVINPGSAPVMIEVKLPGYLNHQLVVNDLGKTSIEYDINLEANNISNIISKIDTVGTELFEIQRLLRSGSYNNSLKRLESLAEVYPSSSIINELIGSAYYLKKDYPNSLVYYDLACKYNIKNIDAFKMKKYLENELGVKRPKSKKE